MPHNKMKQYQYYSTIVPLLLLCLLGLSACYGGGTEIGNPKVGMGSFKNDQELEGYIKGQLTKSVLPDELYVKRNGAFPPASRLEFSSNAQETDVDESDKIKTDGKYLYVAGQQKITVTDISDPDNMRIESTVQINGQVNEIHLYKETLLVVLYFKDYGAYSFTNDMVTDGPLIGIPFWIPIQARTGVALYDMGDPAHPALIQDVVIDGNLISTRLTGGRLHIVQEFMPTLPPLEYSYDGTEKGWVAAISKNQTTLAGLTLDNLLPGYQITDSNGQVVQSGRLIQYQDCYKPTGSGGAGTVTISTFDLDHLFDPMRNVGIIAAAEMIYASSSSLYVTTTDWNYDRSFAENSVSDTATIVHQFDLRKETVSYLAGGRISGRILNQFSLNEYDHVLRVATCSFSWLSPTEVKTGSNVFCLKEKNGELAVVGKIENIAPGDKLYSARFVGERGFLVTYVQVDPLFTLDLSDPTSPKIAGELKVPGYSEYIHPVDQDYILTIGFDVKERNGILIPDDIQLSFFDIRKFSDPQLLHKTKIQVSNNYTERLHSEAMYNHKAFVFLPEKHLLAIPVTRDEFDYTGYFQNSSHRLAVYRITPENGFESLGTIQADESAYLSQSGWLRGLFVDETVFAVEGTAIYAAEIENMGNTIRKLVIPNTPQFRATLKTKSIDGIEKSIFNQGQPIVFTLTYQNLTSQSKTIRFPSSQIYDIELYNSSDNLVWNWGHNGLFTFLMTDLTFGPNESKTFEETWNQADNSDLQAAIGTYNVFTNRKWNGWIYEVDDLFGGPCSIQIISNGE